MKAQMDEILQHHGQTVRLRRENGESVLTHAFLQPILKQRTDPPIAATPLGAVSEKRWMYLGHSDIALAAGDEVQHEALTLRVQETRQVYGSGDTPVYRWALLRPIKEAAE